MREQKQISIIFLSHIAELTGFYPLYYLLSKLAATPAEQILSLGQAILLGLLVIGFNFLLTVRPMRILLWWGANLLAGLGLGYGLQCWMRSENIGFIEYLQSLGPEGHFLSTAQTWVLLVFICLLLIRAISIMGKVVDYKQATRRLEASMAALFTGLLLLNILSVAPDPAFLALGLCLLCNAGALAFTRSSQSNSGQGWLALLVYAAIIAGAGWLIKGMLPALNLASQWLWGNTAPFLGGIISRIVERVFKNYAIREDTGGSAVDNNPPAGSTDLDLPAPNLSPEWMQYLAVGFTWLAVGVLVILVMALLAYLLTRLWYHKNPARLLVYSGGENEGVIRQLIRFLIRLFMRINLLLQPLRVGGMGIAEIYHGLLIWGSLRHQPRQIYETPYEYGERLGSQYPGKQEWIALLTDTYVCWRYGQEKIEGQKLKQMRDCLQLLYKF